MKLMFHILSLVAVVFWMGVATAQSASEELENASSLLSTWEAQAAQVDEALTDATIDDDRAAELREIIEPHRTQARSLSDTAKQELAPLEEQMAALGPPPEEGQSEDASITAERQELQGEIDGLRAIVSKADLAYTRADRLLQEIATAQRSRFTERLLARGPSPVLPSAWLATGESLVSTGGSFVSEIVASGTEIGKEAPLSESRIRGLIALCLTLLLAALLRRNILRQLSDFRIGPAHKPSEAEIAARFELSSKDQSGESLAISAEPKAVPDDVPLHTRKILARLGLIAIRFILPGILFLMLRYSLLQLQILGPVGEAILTGFTQAGIIFCVGYTLVRAFFAPKKPLLRLSSLDDENSTIAARHATFALLAPTLDLLILRVGQTLDWPIEALSALNFIIILLGAIPLWRLARMGLRLERSRPRHRPDPEEADADEEPTMWLSAKLTSICSRFGYAMAVSAPLLALAGYFAFSRYVFYNGLLTAALITLLVLLYAMGKDIGSSLTGQVEEESEGTQADISEPVKKSSLLPVIFGFILCLLALPALALIWGATINDLRDVSFALTNGFKIGDVTFRPGAIVIGLLVFGIGMVLTRSIQTVIRRTVMPNTRLDTGAQSSIISGLGYLGFFISALLAFNVAGLDLTNLAFLGAALGVGIGFGLQNIVNNFVSGIILLVERPIKVGDWIEVGGVHGTVDKIRVRATEIRTFDKASYIVPNSDLISGSVTNMTHADLLGRVTVPIAVAYGSDARKVERLLLEIARAHPMILREPPPSVIFKAFGADALEFELRAFLRDVNWIMFALSDVNFEIDRRFREENIKIPFAQRDLHIKSVGPLVDYIKPSEVEALPGQGHQAPDSPNIS